MNQTPAPFFSWVTLLLCAVALAGCRVRLPETSTTQFVDGLTKDLGIDTLEDQKQLASLCGRNSMIFFIGNAESMGSVYFRPRMKERFGLQTYREWQQEERGREASYFRKILEQQERLRKILGHRYGPGNRRCRRFAEETGAKIGAVHLVSLVDGPSHQGEKDTTLQSWRFAYHKGHWSKTNHRWWTDVDGRFQSHTEPTTFEALLPALLDRVVQDGPKLAAEGLTWEGIDQAFYFFKSHGGRLSTQLTEQMTLGRHHLLGTAPTDSESVFLFDSMGPQGALQETEYFTNLWSLKTHCATLERYTGTQTDRCLVEALESESKPEVADHQSLWLSHLMPLSLGRSLWSLGRQGVEKGAINGGHYPDPKGIFRQQFLETHGLPLTKKRVESQGPAVGNVEAHRFLGVGRTLRAGAATILQPQRFGPGLSEDPVLKLRSGKTATTTVVLDTCLANLSSAGGHGGVPWLEKAPGGLLVFANRGPLKIRALDYGRLDGFSLSLLADQVQRSFSSKASSEERQQGRTLLDRLARGEKAPVADSDLSEFRLVAHSFHCPDYASTCQGKTHLGSLYSRDQILEAVRSIRVSVQERLDKPRTDLADKISFRNYIHDLATYLDEEVKRNESPSMSTTLAIDVLRSTATSLFLVDWALKASESRGSEEMATWAIRLLRTLESFAQFLEEQLEQPGYKLDVQVLGQRSEALEIVTVHALLNQLFNANQAMHTLSGGGSSFNFRSSGALKVWLQYAKILEGASSSLKELVPRTDLVEALETAQAAQPQSNLRDKSQELTWVAWSSFDRRQLVEGLIRPSQLLATYYRGAFLR